MCLQPIPGTRLRGQERCVGSQRPAASRALLARASHLRYRVRCPHRVGLSAYAIRTPHTHGWGQMRVQGCARSWPADVPDRDLVEGCLAGADQAWSSLLERYGRLIDAVIRRYRLTEADHADVFQDVCVAIWRDLPNVRDRARLGPWIVTLTGRHSWDARKRLRPRLSEENDETLTTVPDSQPGPEELMTRREARSEVRAALAKVSKRSRVLLESLFFEEEVSYADIAQRLQVSQNSIGPLRGRSFKELREALGTSRTVS